VVSTYISKKDTKTMSSTTISESARREALDNFAELHKRDFLLPDAASIGDIFTSLGKDIEEQVLGSFCGESYRDPGTSRSRVDRCQISNSVWAFRTRLNGHFRCGGVQEGVLQKIRENMLPVDNDRLYFEIVEWEKDGLALVIVKHNQILGQRYIALVDAASLDTIEA